MTRRPELSTGQDETVGIPDGHPWGDPVAASGDFQWPPTGRFPWPPSRPDCLDLLIRTSAEPTDLRPAHPQPQSLDDLLDTARARAAHTRLLHARSAAPMPRERVGRRVHHRREVEMMQMTCAALEEGLNVETIHGRPPRGRATMHHRRGEHQPRELRANRPRGRRLQDPVGGTPARAVQAPGDKAVAGDRD
jgi:hypothetical protein